MPGLPIGIFILAAFVMLNLMASGLVDLGNLGSWERLHAAFASAGSDLTQGSWLTHYGNFRHPHLLLHPGLFRDRIGDPDRRPGPELA